MNCSTYMYPADPHEEVYCRSIIETYAAELMHRTKHKMYKVPSKKSRNRTINCFAGHPVHRGLLSSKRDMNWLKLSPRINDIRTCFSVSARTFSICEAAHEKPVKASSQPCVFFCFGLNLMTLQIILPFISCKYLNSNQR